MRKNQRNLKRRSREGSLNPNKTNIIKRTRTKYKLIIDLILHLFWLKLKPKRLYLQISVHLIYRISDLPNNILRHIILKLPCESVAQTRLLSTRWLDVLSTYLHFPMWSYRSCPKNNITPLSCFYKRLETIRVPLQA